MRRGYMLYLEDILTSTSKILKYVGDMQYHELLIDEMRIEAIVRNFEIIGEAASKVPQDIREKYEFIAWRKIADFRNVLAHEYFAVDYEIMWEIIKEKLPVLQNDIQKVLKEEQS